MPILLCPGVHPPAFTAAFLRAFPAHLAAEVIISPSNRPYSGWHLFQFLQQIPVQQRQQPLQIIAFSAGVVGAMAAIPLWQASGGRVQSLFAIDGWGVPLIALDFAPYAIYRLSHDRFTDWSSALLGSGRSRFFADPPVAHLELWRAPQTVRGWAIQSNRWEQTTAADFLLQRLAEPKDSLNDQSE